MKFYYGNDYDEALSNDPVDIKSVKVLEQYMECYNCVIRADEVDEEEEEE